MDDHIKWLEELLEKKQQQVREAEKELLAIKQALIIAKRDQENISGKKTIFKRRRKKPTLLDVAEEVLRGWQPMTTEELREFIEDRGKKTTLNSLAVSLNRERPERFDKDSDGKWYVVQKEETIKGRKIGLGEKE